LPALFLWPTIGWRYTCTASTHAQPSMTHAKDTSSKTAPSIFLVGPMGSGKSAVGRRLARDLGREFVDSDTVIEERTGVDISYIFEKEGEDGFRRRETEIIDELTQQAAIVLATGGGAVLADENRIVLASRGRVVYLHATIKEQIERTSHSRHRPLLTAGEPGEVLAQLMAIREPLYQEVADIQVETDGRAVVDVASEIARRLSAVAD
jgi:shikimate kinase